MNLATLGSKRSPRGLPAMTLCLLALALGAVACGGADDPSAGPELPASRAGSRGAGDPDPGVQVQVVINRSPRLTSLTGQQVFTVDAAGVATMRAVLRVTALDEDGDDLTFTWSAPDCPGAVLEVGPAADAPEESDADDQDDQDEDGDEDGDEEAGAGWSEVRFTGPAGLACPVLVQVRDAWAGGQAPAGSGLPLAKGGLAEGVLELAPAPTVTPPGP